MRLCTFNSVFEPRWPCINLISIPTKTRNILLNVYRTATPPSQLPAYNIGRFPSSMSYFFTIYFSFFFFLRRSSVWKLRIKIRKMLLDRYRVWRNTYHAEFKILIAFTHWHRRSKIGLNRNPISQHHHTFCFNFIRLFYWVRRLWGENGKGTMSDKI